jgi:hypothetical protein
MAGAQAGLTGCWASLDGWNPGLSSLTLTGVMSGLNMPPRPPPGGLVLGAFRLCRCTCIKTPAARCPPLIRAPAAGRSLTFPLTVPPALPYCAPVPSILRPFFLSSLSSYQLSIFFPSLPITFFLYLFFPHLASSVPFTPSRPSTTFIKLVAFYHFNYLRSLPTATPFFKHTQTHCPSVHLHEVILYSAAWISESNPSAAHGR